MIIKIFTKTQQLVVYQEQAVLAEYAISSALQGLGEQRDSYRTPRGWHQVRAKIGEGQPINSVFVARRPTGEIYSPVLNEIYPERDWILTRILWLSGLEIGFNRLGHCDTFRRFIYIHGCPDQAPMGVAQSHGCIRMRNQDIVELFSLIKIGTRVYITE